MHAHAYSHIPRIVLYEQPVQNPIGAVLLEDESVDNMAFVPALSREARALLQDLAGVSDFDLVTARNLFRGQPLFKSQAHRVRAKIAKSGYPHQPAPVCASQARAHTPPSQSSPPRPSPDHSTGL